jgi:glycosyltransferase involved in cell wall biosynthesis
MMLSLRVPRERITLTPFVVDNDWWSAEAARVNRATVRKSWGIAPEASVVLFCAKLQPWKRPVDLLRAFAAADVPSAVLVFAGDGPLLTQLNSEAKALGIESRVRFLGFINQMQLPSVYSAADLLVLPSEYDPCPVVVCESMVCGLPVLLSDKIRGRFDLVIPGQTGEIFPCGDVNAIAMALRKLLADRAALATLSENARARMNSWSLQEAIAGTVQAIDQSLKRRQR